MSNSDTSRPEPNQHVRAHLTYYIGFQQPPRYAVMLSGKWGAGKTHQVKKILDELFPKTDISTKRPYVLVSLYGLKTPQEIDDAMVAAIYPWTEHGGVRIASAVGKAFLKHAKIDLPELKSSDFINRMSADIFVFDDLERCRMPVIDAFGYINQLVERDGCKVIILANEDEIKDQDKYFNGKEKIIGKTLEVEPDFDAAFDDFLKRIDDNNTNNLFDKLKSKIQEIYNQSSLKNLRILQQTMWDFERVYKVVDQRHRSNVPAMEHLLRLFFALCFEYKSGALTPDILRARTKQSLFDSMSTEKAPSPFARATAKYPGLYIYDSILSDDVVADIFIRGLVNADAVASALDASSWFIPVNEPSWHTIWRSNERPDADVRAAATTMISEFNARHYKITGEFLHLFGQMLFLADIGFSGRDRASTLADCKAYVDDIRLKGALESPTEAYLDDIRNGSYGGLGFSQNDTTEFRELWGYVQEQRAAAEIDRYPNIAQQLLDLMKTDPSDFVRQITYIKDGAAPFAHRPVLASADPNDFADVLISLEPMAFREVLLGLSSRYDMAKLAKGRELSGEREWAEALEASLLNKAAKLEPFARDRISKTVEWTLGKDLKEFRAAEKAPV
jgi:hypothetical protein